MTVKALEIKIWNGGDRSTRGPQGMTVVREPGVNRPQVAALKAPAPLRERGRASRRERRCQMIYFGACPKCQGDVKLSHDGYGSFLSCLQCGLMRDLESQPTVVSKPMQASPVWLEEKEQLPLAA